MKEAWITQGGLEHSSVQIKSSVGGASPTTWVTPKVGGAQGCDHKVCLFTTAALKTLCFKPLCCFIIGMKTVLNRRSTVGTILLPVV